MLSLLIHLGYPGYDDKRREVFIPNREILDEFKLSTKGAVWKPAFRTLSMSQEILMGQRCGIILRLDHKSET